MSGQSLDDLLYSVAKNRALEWEKTRQKLKEMGKDEAFIKEKGGLNEENLEILYEELAEKAEFEQHGLDLTVKKDYKLSNLDYRAFYQYLAVWHCLAIGLYADILFLGNSWDNTPLLPSFIPYLLEKYQSNPLLTPDFWQEAISKIVKCYVDFYDSLTVDSAYCAPDVRMKLALSLANLPSEYGYLALEQGNKAFSDWLDVNNVPSDKVFDVENDEDCQVLKRIIYQEDKPFLESLKLLLEKVRDGDKIETSQTEGINSLLLGWQFLSRFGNIPQLPAMEAVGLPMIVEEKVKPNIPNPSENFTEMLPGEVALEMISIPAGEFLMGSNDNALPLDYDFYSKQTIPIHQVYLQRFYMGKYPITQAQWMTLMEENPSQFKGKDHPVNNINMKKAQDFCQKLSEITGKRYQLPTEAQWEYACQAGSITKWHFGNDENQLGELGEYAWYKENSNKTCSVGQLKPNQWGLYDMYGNVWEWCQDYHWLSYYIPNLQAVDVTFNYHEYTILKEENKLVRRGGNYLCTADLCCSANRNFSVELPIDADISALGEGTGFRIVCVP